MFHTVCVLCPCHFFPQLIQHVESSALASGRDLWSAVQLIIWCANKEPLWLDWTIIQYIQSCVVFFSAVVGRNRPVHGKTRDVVFILWAILRKQIHRSASVTDQDPENCPFISYMHVSDHLSSVILLIPDQGDRWCWSRSQWSLGKSLDKPPVHQSPVYLMFMDRRKKKNKGENPLRREENVSTHNGWESNPEPVCSDVTAVTTAPFLQAALEKYINYSKVFSQRRIVRKILWC